MLSACQLVSDMFSPVGVWIEVAGKDVGKEEKFHDYEKDEQFHKDDDPKGFPYGHFPEAGVIEKPDFLQ